VLSFCAYHIVGVTLHRVPIVGRTTQKQNNMESNYSLADLSAACGCNGNQQWNNPMWLIWALLFGFGGNGFGFNRGAGDAVQTAALSGQIDALRNQMADNHNSDITNAAIGGVGSAVNQANIGNLLGQKDMQAAMQSCCCDIKSSVLNQTTQLQDRISQLASGVQTGFANLGFLTQQQTTELNAAATANTQRILDKMCADTTQNLRDKLAEASQNAQTSYLISQLKTTA